MDLNSLKFAKFQSATAKVNQAKKLFKIASGQNTFYFNPRPLKYRPQTENPALTKGGGRDDSSSLLYIVSISSTLLYIVSYGIGFFIGSGGISYRVISQQFF